MLQPLSSPTIRMPKAHLFITGFLVCLSMILASTPAAQAGTKHRKPAEGRYASIVIDADTGAVLSASSPDKQLHPASLTKMMTLLLAFDALADGHLRTSDYIGISPHAAAMSPSKLGIQPGGRLRVDDALRAIAIKSANDIAVAMAEALGGTESRFAKMMNARARQIGMTHSQFVNASGLHNMFQVSTARDMAILGRYIIKTYPTYYRYFGLRQFTWGGRIHPNHNRLMNTYAGMDGMKTGYISQAGFNLVASAKRGNTRLIGVVFGGRTARARNDQMAKLLNVAFAGGGTRPAPDRLPEPIQLAQDQPQDSEEDEESNQDGLMLSRTNPVAPAAFADPAQKTWTVAARVITDPDAQKNKIVAFAPRPPALPARRTAQNLATITPAAGDDQEGGDMDAADIPAPPKTPARKTRAALPSGKGILTLPPSASTDQGPLVLARLSQKESYPKTNAASWAVQIGSYQSRDATDRALYTAMKKLPRDLAHANPVVAPYKSMESGWLFRARLGNLNADQARRACTHFQGCMILPPEAD